MAEEHDHVLIEEDPDTVAGPIFCVNHPNVETGLRCNRCGDPICVRCAVRTPVGYRCQRCIREQQAVFYTGLPVDYIVAAVISLPTAAAGAYLISVLGFSLFGIFFAFLISPAAGALVADLAWRAVGRRRSRYLWLVVCGSIVIATLGVALYRSGSNIFRLDLGIYLVMAVSAAYGRLRLG
jgi:hypothetical protein